jgi:hypothetical protein
MIEVLLAKDDEEIQSLEFYRLYPSLDECFLIWRSGSRGLDSAADVFENLIEIRDVHAITITNEIFDPQISFARLLDESMGLANHPFGIGFEAAGRAEHPSSAKMDERQDKRLPQPSRRPDHLTEEEVNLPERVDMSLEKLVPSPRSTLGTRLYTFFLENVLDCRLGHTE